MKKLNKKILIILLLIIISIIPFIITRADSGWDTSYSGGSSSYSSGGSYSSSGSYDYSTDGSSSNPYSNLSDKQIIFYIILLTIICLISIYFLVICIRNLIDLHRLIKNPKLLSKKNNYLSQEEVNKVDSTIVLDDFYKKIYDEYVDIQIAWRDFDYETLRKNLSDELFNTYKMQLETLKLKNQKNIMTNFEFIDAGITSINQTNKTIEIQMELHVTQTDYVINERAQKVIHGDPSLTSDVTYKLTLIKKSNKNDVIKNCPNCGHELDDSASLVCPYCNSVIVKESNYYILTKKEAIDQRWI